MRVSSNYLLVLASLAALGLFAGESAVADDDRVFIGYVYRLPEEIPFSRYTHLCHAFLVADGEGTIQPSRNIPSRELTTQAHQAGVKVLLSLGGWGWDEQFAAIVASPAAEDRYVESVMKIVDEYDYDGIDLDWEYPDTASEVPGFERLTRRFRAQLDALGAKKNRPHLQTMAVSANPGTLRWLSKDVLLETMDWVNVMTYDYTGDWTEYAGHHSPLFASSRQPGEPRSTERTMQYLVDQHGMPANRLAVGIPLYGRGFIATEPYASKQQRPGMRVPGGGYDNLHRLLHEDGWTRQWDDETKNPWLISPDRDIVIGYDDQQSVTIKTEWAMQHGYRGIFFWQISSDRLPDGSFPLQEAAHAEWEKHVSDE